METRRDRLGDKGYVWFKSYYVVWKRLFGMVDPPDAESLNRTMQYGNLKMWS